MTVDLVEKRQPDGSTGLRLRRYAVALAAVLALVLVRRLLAPVFGDHFRFMLLLPAVVFSAWYGGLGPGLVATVLSAGAATYLFQEPRYAFTIENTEYLTALCAFVLVGGFISLLSENLIQARRRLESLLGLLQRREIAEHQRAEEALRESEHRFTEFMQHLPGIAFMKDVEGRYVWVNATFERVFHGASQDYVGKTDEEIWPAATAAELRENDQTVLRTRQTLHLTQVVPQDDGGHYWLTTKFPILNEDGTPRMVAGVAIDITEQRRTAAQLRELERLSRQRERLADIGAITAQIVHDLGNPLAGLSMQAQLALHRARRDERQPVSVVLQPLERLVVEVRRLDERIKEFMEFSHEQRLELKRINLGTLLQEVVDIWQLVAAERGISLSVEMPDGGPSLTADDEKLRRVFDNLVKNAIEAIDRGPGYVAIQVTEPTPQAVCITVSDTGPGIPDTVQAFRLFETTKVNGSGLGLAVVKQIVLAHRGTIEFSRRMPHGTVFRLELPRGGPARA